MPRTTLNEIQVYLSELFQSLHEKQRFHDPSIVGVSYLPAWPEVVHNRSIMELKHVDPEESKKQILQRLKSFKYPYPHGSRANQSFFKKVKSLNLLESLLTPPLLFDIRMVWQSRRYDQLELKLKDDKLSQYKLPLKFHREMLALVYGHMKHVKLLADKYQISKDGWLRDYLACVDNELFQEGAAYYPQGRRWFRPAHEIRNHSTLVLEQVDLYCALVAAFAKRGVANNKLALHLTALLCSPLDCILAKKLDPYPEKVRKYVQDALRKKSITAREAGRTKAPNKPAKLF